MLQDVECRIRRLLPYPYERDVGIYTVIVGPNPLKYKLPGQEHLKQQLNKEEKTRGPSDDGDILPSRIP